MTTEVGTLLQPHREWLEARGISSSLAEKFGLKSAVTSFPPEGEDDKWERAKCIAIPYLIDGQVVNHKYRRVDPKQHVMDKGGKRCLWNMDAVKRAAGGTLVITEGEWDAMIAEDLGWAASSVPNGTPKKSSEDPANDGRYEYLWEAKDDLAKVKHFIIATDGDAPGIALRTDLIALLTPQRCSFLEYPVDTKDLTDVYMIYGVEAVSQCLNGAKPVPVKGLYRITDFPEMPELPLTPVMIDGISIGTKEDLWGLVPTTTTMVTGFPGQGKSSLVLKAIGNLLLANIPVTVASFETIPRPILERKLLACMARRSEYDPTIWRNAQAVDALHSLLTVIANTPDDDHELDLERTMDLFETAVARNGSKLSVLDPWNELEHKRQRDESETDYTGRAIRTIKRFTHRTHTAAWIVAHPRKPSTDGMPKHAPSLYDLAGSANWYNKADYGVIVHRPDLETNETDVIVSKVRMGLPGRVGRVVLEYHAGRSDYGLLQC